MLFDWAILQFENYGAIEFSVRWLIHMVVSHFLALLKVKLTLVDVLVGNDFSIARQIFELEFANEWAFQSLYLSVGLKEDVHAALISGGKESWANWFDVMLCEFLLNE